MEFRDPSGSELSLAEADAERELVYNAYVEERIACEKRYKRQEQALDGHKRWYVSNLCTCSLLLS